MKGKMKGEGMWMEKVEDNGGKYMGEEVGKGGEGEGVGVEVKGGMKEMVGELWEYGVCRGLWVKGRIMVGGDIGEGKVKEGMDKGEGVGE